MDLQESTLPSERALGLEWDPQDDTLKIRIKLKDPVLTKRGLLSYVSSVYDPLGFVSPYVLTAKKLFQQETRLRKDWDDKLESSTSESFAAWMQQLPDLAEIPINRCIWPHDNDKIKEIQLHHFADASSEAYGTASYIRITDTSDNYHVSFVFGKSRLAPIKAVSIPRLELMAAVAAVNVDEMLRKELDLEVSKSFFWSDSMAVLGYIRNEDKKFDVFVANRISRIHELTAVAQWRHVSTNDNPADDASRGIKAKALNQRWLTGPAFLSKGEDYWPSCSDNKPECLDAISNTFTKKQNERGKLPNAVNCHVASNETFPECIRDLLNRYSCYYKLKRAVAWLTKFCKWQLSKRPKVAAESLSVDDLHLAETAIVKCVQNQHFKTEIEFLKRNKCLLKSSNLHKLEPFLDDKGIIRVGGRLCNAPLDATTRNQILLPRDDSVTTMIIRQIHAVQTRHAGNEHVLSVLREKFWVPKARSRIKLILHQCIICRILYAQPKPQRMGDLPRDRLAAYTRPFSRVGIDCFGPFYVKRGRSQEKRYGCIFTCLVTRAIHIEVLSSLEADAFINAVMRFSARRGRPTLVRCDNGTNFVGASKELKSSIQDWNKRVHKDLMQKDIKWIFNPPAASHMGGVWERLIRSTRRILSALMRGLVLDDERLSTFMCEAEAIINSRPITKSSQDPNDFEALTPNHLLLMRGDITLPPGQFTLRDIYSKRWRHVQYLAERFWKRWSREYVATIQHRQKWLKPVRNFAVNDIVLICDEVTPRNTWPLGRVTETTQGRDKCVRSVTVQTKNSILRRPVNKLCLLEEAS